MKISKNIKNILVIRLDALGDLILSTPFFYNLRKMYPHSKISALVKPYTKDVLINNPDIDEILIYPDNQTSKGKKLFEKKLRGNRYDLAVSLSPITSSYKLTFSTGARIRAGYVYSDRPVQRLMTKFLLNICPVLDIQGEIKSGMGVSHEVRQTFSILKALGGTPEEVPLTLFVGEPPDIPSPNRIGIHLSPKWFTQPWRFSDFDMLCKQILDNFTNYNLLITYGTAEEYLLDKIELKNNNKIIFKGGLSFPDWAKEISTTDLFISTDTGALHCAVALGKKVIGIYEDSTFDHCSSQWAPWMVESEIIRKKKPDVTIKNIVDNIRKLLQIHPIT